MEQARRDLQMAKKLDGIVQAKATLVDGRFDTAQAPLAYLQAFQAYGLALQEEGVVELTERIRGSDIKQELVNALDDWAFLEPSDLVRKLTAVASRDRPVSLARPGSGCGREAGCDYVGPPGKGSTGSGAVHCRSPGGVGRAAFGHAPG